MDPFGLNCQKANDEYSFVDHTRQSGLAYVQGSLLRLGLFLEYNEGSITCACRGTPSPPRYVVVVFTLNRSFYPST